MSQGVRLVDEVTRSPVTGKLQIKLSDPPVPWRRLAGREQGAGVAQGRGVPARVVLLFPRTGLNLRCSNEENFHVT